MQLLIPFVNSNVYCVSLTIWINYDGNKEFSSIGEDIFATFTAKYGKNYLSFPYILIQFNL